MPAGEVSRIQVDFQSTQRRLENELTDLRSQVSSHDATLRKAKARHEDALEEQEREIRKAVKKKHAQHQDELDEHQAMLRKEALPHPEPRP